MHDRVLENRARYNRISGLYEALLRFGSFGQFSRFHRAVGDAIEPVSGGLILDIGCGPGTLVPYLLPKVGADGSILGVDIAEGMIERARSLAARRGWQNVRFERSDVREFSPRTKADAVVFCLSLTTMPEPQDSLARALTWLRAAGQLVVFDSFLGTAGLLAGLTIRLKSPLVGADPAAVSAEEIVSQLESARLERFHRGVYTLISGRKVRAQRDD